MEMPRHTPQKTTLEANTVLSRKNTNHSGQSISTYSADFVPSLSRFILALSRILKKFNLHALCIGPPLQKRSRWAIILIFLVTACFQRTLELLIQKQVNIFLRSEVIPETVHPQYNHREFECESWHTWVGAFQGPRLCGSEPLIFE